MAPLHRLSDLRNVGTMGRSDSREADAVAAALLSLVDGCALAIGHVFECLDRQGVMSRSEALAMIRHTVAQLPPGSQSSSVVLRQAAKFLRDERLRSPSLRSVPEEASRQNSGIVPRSKEKKSS